MIGGGASKPKCTGPTGRNVPAAASVRFAAQPAQETQADVPHVPHDARPPDGGSDQRRRPPSASTGDWPAYVAAGHARLAYLGHMDNLDSVEGQQPAHHAEHLRPHHQATAAKLGHMQGGGETAAHAGNAPERAATRRSLPPAQQAASRPPRPPAPAKPAGGVQPQPGELVPMTKMRSIIAQAHGRIQAHQRARPHCVQGGHDAHRPKLREKEKNKYEQRNGAKLTYMPFITRAAIQALKQASHRQRRDPRRSDPLQQEHQHRHRGRAGVGPDRAGDQDDRREELPRHHARHRRPGRPRAQQEARTRRSRRRHLHA